MGYNPTVDMRFFTPNIMKGASIGFIIQTLILFFYCEFSIAMFIFSVFIFIFLTSWIYGLITLPILAITGRDY